MITRESLADVEVLLPARVHQERARFVAALRAELVAVIAALPTASRTRPNDVAQDRSSARHVLPTGHLEEIDDGHS